MQYEVEGTVRAIYRRADVALTEVRYAPWLLRKAYGPKCLRRVRLANGALGELAVVGGSPVFVANAVLPEQLRWWVWFHEAAHYERGTTCRRHGGSREYEELICDAVGAAAMMARPAFQARLNELGVDLAQLATDFRTTQTSVARRIGEVEGRPVAVRLARRAEPYLAGPEWWAATAEDVRRLERGERPDVTKIRLSDAKGVALLLHHDPYSAA